MGRALGLCWRGGGGNGRGEVGLRGAGLRAEVRLAGPRERGSRPGRCVVRTGRGGEVRAARGEGLRGRVGLVLGLVGPGFWAGLGFLGWIGFGVFLFLSNASPISFLFSNSNSNDVEFKFRFESNTSIQTNRRNAPA